MTSELLLNGNIELYAGDMLAVLPTLPANSVDSVVCDPPYHLTSIVKRFGSKNAAPAKGNQAFVRASKGFMNQTWDGGDIAFDPDTWLAVLRVLKPGGHMVAFSGTRTYHRMACAIEDAGFEIRDQIGWAYGSGFPKSHDVSKGIDKAAGAERDVVGVRTSQGGMTQGGGEFGQALSAMGREIEITAPATNSAREWQGWGTALKPAWEPIVLARKPLSESTVAANVLKWGTGAINVDGCRVGTGEDKGVWPITDRRHDDVTYTLQPVSTDTTKGRWPANLILSYPEDEYQLKPFVTPEQKRELFGWLHANT